MIQKKLPFTIFATAALFFCGQTKAQLVINSATFFIQPGATVTVQGNVTSNTDIQGTGLVVLNGSANQTVDMGGSMIPKLQINNAANATLLSNLLIGDSLTLTSGKITLGTNNITLATTAGTTGGSTASFIETNSTGQAIKDLAANATSYEIPVGVGTSFRPAFITTAGTYSASANVGVQASSIADPNRPPMISDYLLTYWPVTQTGITGTLNVAGQYNNSGDISGSQSNLKGYFFNGTDWSSAKGTSTTASNQVAANVTTQSGDVYGMDGFILLKAKVFLQGAYNTSTPLLMSDNLRSLNVIPTSDPYRVAPYSTFFTPVDDAITETASSSVFTSKANVDSNIVDWVFLELRNTTASPGNTVLQTRSAFVERNGTIVDVDGESPITFNNVPAGSYRIAVRHRNHLGVCINTTNLQSLSETRSTASTLDFTNNIAELYTPTSATNPPIATLATGVYGLYGGNANGDGFTKKTGAASVNDYSVLLSNVATVASPGPTGVYSNSDFNMDGNVRKTGPASTNDYSILLSILNSANTNIITQPTF